MRVPALLAACLSLGASSRANLPPTLADYRSWHSLSAEPTLVPASLLTLCTPVSNSHRAAAAGTHGPHGDRYVRVYVNPVARRVLSDAETRPFPPGAVIAKEKVRRPGDRRAAEVAVMIKREPGQFTESDGWEFRYYPSRTGAGYTACVECHRTGASRDYVFSRNTPGGRR